jgi:hypothetical protein
MRSGTTGDRVTLNSLIPQARVACRRCGAQLETLAHVLGQCTHTESMVIKRHDSIRNFVSSTAARKLETKILEEPSIKTPEGILKPDLIILHQKRVHVVDVTVRYEDVGYLQQGHNE